MHGASAEADNTWRLLTLQLKRQAEATDGAPPRIAAEPAPGDDAFERECKRRRRLADIANRYRYPAPPHTFPASHYAS